MEIANIQKRIDQIDKLEIEAKTLSEYLKSELENDEIYKDANEKVKEATANKKKIKDQILSQNANQEQLAKIKESADEISTLKQILSVELMEFYQESKNDFVPDARGGEPRKFVLTARLLPKKNYRQGRDNFGQYSSSSSMQNIQPDDHSTTPTVS